MKYPIIFIHEGNQEYLKYAIKSVKDQKLDIFLLGDDSNKIMCNKWESIQEIDITKFNKFKTNYKHMSSNSYEFELLCFKRYFILLEFMKKKNLKGVIMLDSDVLIYTNFSEYEFNKYSVALSTPKRQENYRWSTSPHCSFWTLNALEEFIDFCIDTYKYKINILEEKFNYHNINNIKGGVCDMTLLYLWSKDRSDILNLTEIYDGGVIDKSISGSENYYDYEYKKWSILKIKKVIFDENKNYYFINKQGHKVKVKLLHCQGAAKNLMEPLYNKNIKKVKFNRLRCFYERIFKR